MVEKPRSAGRLPDRIRHRFPIFERLVYINSCSQGALSDAVRQSYEDYLRDWDEKGAPWEYWVERTEAARGAFARLINAEPDEIAVTTSVSAGVSALASGLRYGARSKIVLSEREFPTVGQIWHAQEARGARVVHAHPDDFERVVDEDTAVVSITHVSFRTGEMYDPKRAADLAHKHGALMLLDAYQTVGSVPIDVKELDVDFLTAGALKYLLASAGLGFFYCRRELWERAWPTATGWFADQDIFKMDPSRYAPSPTARRFQSGTPPIPSIYAGIAGIELMQEIGIEETHEHVRGLNARLIAGVEDLGAALATPKKRHRHGALVCVKSNDVEELVAALRRWGIVASERDSNLRISAHAYNSVEDIDLVLEALARHKHLLVASTRARSAHEARR
jgi:selenocysteine lyase/cysteine desulfurase